MKKWSPKNFRWNCDSSTSSCCCSCCWWCWCRRWTIEGVCYDSQNQAGTNQDTTTANSNPQPQKMHERNGIASLKTSFQDSRYVSSNHPVSQVDLNYLGLPKYWILDWVSKHQIFWTSTLQVRRKFREMEKKNLTWNVHPILRKGTVSDELPVMLQVTSLSAR